MDEDIRNGNIFLIGNGFGKPPKIYSSFQRAERVLLDKIRALDCCGFCDTITCVQINTNHTRETIYHGDIKVKDGFKHITIKRDERSQNCCKKIHREKIRINLDY